MLELKLRWSPAAKNVMPERNSMLLRLVVRISVTALVSFALCFPTIALSELPPNYPGEIDCLGHKMWAGGYLSTSGPISPGQVFYRNMVVPLWNPTAPKPGKVGPTKPQRRVCFESALVLTVGIMQIGRAHV